MEMLHRLFKLDRILRDRRYPVSQKILLEKLECSKATFKRLLRILNDNQIHIIYCRKGKGYCYDPEGKTEIPGLWFSYDELQALLIMHQILNKLQPGLVNTYFKPLLEQVNSLLLATGKKPAETIKCLQMAPIAHQNIPAKIFSSLSQSVLKKHKIAFAYRDIYGQLSERTVSPQRLIYYRDNWYLDAWCHLRQALRTFWVASIDSIQEINEPAELIEERKLEDYFESSYGIFTGAPDYTAHLRFTGQSIMRARGAQWHPAQRQQMNEDGSLELWVPYSDHRELAMDILRYGAEVEVLAPAVLRDEIISRLKKAINLYLNEEEAQPVS